VQVAAGTPTVSLWARVPHYVAAMPFPEASAALLDGLAGRLGALERDWVVRSADLPAAWP